jgi:hypothetical protein
MEAVPETFLWLRYAQRKKIALTGAGVGAPHRYPTCRTTQSQARQEIEVGFGMNPRHDLIGENGKARRGGKGLALVEGSVAENLETGSNWSVDRL